MVRIIFALGRIDPDPDSDKFSDMKTDIRIIRITLLPESVFNLTANLHFSRVLRTDQRALSTDQRALSYIEPYQFVLIFVVGLRVSQSGHIIERNWIAQ